jgi:hypothetical protein
MHNLSESSNEIRSATKRGLFFASLSDLYLVKKQCAVQSPAAGMTNFKSPVTKHTADPYVYVPEVSNRNR